jgi:hypothetical protein
MPARQAILTAMPINELQHYVRVYDNDLEPAFCQRMIDSFNSLPRFHQFNGRGVRNGFEESAWTELNITGLADEGFLGFFRARIDLALDRYNRDVGLEIPVPNSPKTADLVMKRYRAGAAEKFQTHFDSIYEAANRYLVILWYLNDVAEGGETSFDQLGLKVQARQGRLLVFPPYWMFQHSGMPAVSNDKYIASTYLLF